MYTSRSQQIHSYTAPTHTSYEEVCNILWLYNIIWAVQSDQCSAAKQCRVAKSRAIASGTAGLDHFQIACYWS